jgi:hypothetical protein
MYFGNWAAAKEEFAALNISPKEFLETLEVLDVYALDFYSTREELLLDIAYLGYISRCKD